MGRNFGLKAQAGPYVLTGRSAKLTHRALSSAVRKNPWLLAVYAVITVAGIIISYWALWLP